MLPSSPTSYSRLFHAPESLALLVPRQVLEPRSRQPSLLQFLLDDLPPTNFCLLLDGFDLGALRPDVGQIIKQVLELNLLRQLRWLGLLGGEGQEMLDSCAGTEARVGNVVSCELEETLADLREG